jgi:hypothetical protein
MKDFNRALLEVYAHPGCTGGTASQFVQRALDCVLKCETKIIIVDDLHFLKWKLKNGKEVSNHFKHIANEFPVTLIFIGVELERRGLYSEADEAGDVTVAQTARRTTPLTMNPFGVDDDQHRSEFRNFLLAVEQRLVLCKKYPGMLADDLSDYLYVRSTGHIGSLMTLINRGCQRDPHRRRTPRPGPPRSREDRRGLGEGPPGAGSQVHGQADDQPSPFAPGRRAGRVSRDAAYAADPDPSAAG